MDRIWGDRESRDLDAQLRLIANGYFTLIPRSNLSLDAQYAATVRALALFSQWLAVTQTLSQDSNITHSSAYSHAVHDGLTSSTLHVEIASP